MDVIGYGIVGSGYFGSELARIMNEKDGACIRAVYDPEQGETAAKHGLHVFCEKPIALNYRDCCEMVSACKENKVIFMAGHVMNFFNGVRKAYHHGIL